MGGALSRTKGHNFEREVASKLRDAFPTATVRRSDQGFGAREADVVVQGDAPALVKSLWMECQCSRKPTPLGKLYQAENDLVLYQGGDRTPVVIWRKHGARQTQATMRFGALMGITGDRCLSIHRDMPITIDFDDFLTILKVAQ